MNEITSAQRSVLITGCSSGIGYDAAHTLKNRGWRVFATCRKTKDCERLESEGLESWRLDYADEKSIGDAVERVLQATGGRLDALFNNGGFAMPAAVEDVPREAMRRIFETNFFGYHDLTCRVLPTMRSQGHGRIANCSSILGFTALRWRGPYNSTKFALEGLTDTLRLELHGSGIHAILIEPGPIATRIRQNSRQHFQDWISWEESHFEKIYRNAIMPRLFSDDKKPDPFELPASAVTRKLIHALEARKPRSRYYVTTPTYVFGILKRILPTYLYDRAIAAVG